MELLTARVNKLGDNGDLYDKLLDAHNKRFDELEKKLLQQNGRTTRQRADIELARTEMGSIQERLRIAEEELVECNAKVRWKWVALDLS